MNKIIQSKIDQMNELAKSGMKTPASHQAGGDYKKDSLSKSIRNAKEASVFLAELEAIVKLARSQ